MTIDRFSGEYRFLSNFYPCDIIYEGEVYASVEHAYQAAKTKDPFERKVIQRQETPGRAKREGQHVTLAKGWDSAKVLVMEDLLRQKFNYPSLREKLYNTKGHDLIEGNDWGDTFWGEVDGVGQNHLGKLLMKIREKLPPIRYLIVETDNFDGDHPNEKFVAFPPTSLDKAKRIADAINKEFSGSDAPRYWKVVRHTYELKGGFEP